MRAVILFIAGVSGILFALYSIYSMCLELDTSLFLLLTSTLFVSVSVQWAKTELKKNNHGKR